MGALKVGTGAAPLVSVLMSVHNGARYLEAAVESILAQTLADLELIVVDDASTDRSGGMCLALAARDPRIVLLVNDERVGLTRSLNLALRAARGAYIARMDADDISLPHRLETQVRYLESRPDVGLVGSFYTEIGADNEVRTPVYRFPTEPIIVSWRMAFENPLPHPPIVARRHVMDAAAGYDERWRTTQDYDLFTRLAGFTKLANCPEVLFHWRRHSESVSSERNAEQRENALCIAGRYIGCLLGQPVPRDLVELLWRRQPAGAGEAARFVSTAVTLARRVAAQPHWSEAERHLLRRHVSRHLLHDVTPHARRSRTWRALARLVALSPSLVPEVAGRWWTRRLGSKSATLEDTAA